MKSFQFVLFLTVILFGSCTNYVNPFDNPELTWIEVASGERQCIAPTYPSLENATDLLSRNGIEVFESTTLNFPVCEACSCPTGTVYQAQIRLLDFDKAEGLGWSERDSVDN